MLILSRSADNYLHIGDSLSTGFGAGTSAVVFPLGQSLATSSGAPVVPPITAPAKTTATQKRPLQFVNALAGRKAVDISGSMSSIRGTFIKFCTAAIIWLGVNDAIAIANSTETLLQFSTAQLAIVDDLNTAWGIPYAKMLWVGPWADNGAATAAIASVNGQCVTNAALRGFTFVQVSQVPFAGSPDGLHPTPTQAYSLVAVVTPSISIAT